MVDARRVGMVRPVGDEHDAKRAQPVREHGHRRAERHEGEAPSRAAQHEHREEHAIGHRRDQEAQPRAGLRDVEVAAWRRDEDAVDVVRDGERVEPGDDEARRHVLERRDELLARRHEEEQVERRREQRAPRAQAEHREEEALQQPDQRELLRLVDRRRVGREPGRAARERRERGQQRGRARPDPGEDLASLEQHPGRDRHDEEAVVEGRRRDPDPDGRERRLAEGDQQRAGPERDRERGLPPGPARLGGDVRLVALGLGHRAGRASLRSRATGSGAHGGLVSNLKPRAPRPRAALTPAGGRVARLPRRMPRGQGEGAWTGPT